MSVRPLFRDRHAAGVALASALSETLVCERVHNHALDHASQINRTNLIVLGMARGGVAVAAPVAHAFAAPLDTFIGRKLGVPGIEEVAFGAVTECGGPPVLDDVHSFIGLPRTVVRDVLVRELDEVARRKTQYRDGMSFASIKGCTVIVVDDGLASGATLRAAGIALRRLKPARLIAAVPVASVDGKRNVIGTFDEVITLATPESFGTVSDWYDEYEAVDDATVRALLGRQQLRATNRGVRIANERETETVERVVTIPTRETGSTPAIIGDLGQPGNKKPPRGLVIFAHGGGSSRASYRNRYLAARIRMAGWATLRVDLLGANETAADEQGDVRFDIALITRRLLAAAKWCVESHVAGSERIVLFGASTGAAAAMGVAATLPSQVAAVISRGGRIDLAAESLGRVRASSFLVVGDADGETLERNRQSAEQLGGNVTLRVVPGAGHTFEEAGALGQVGELVASFLTRLHRHERLMRWWHAIRRIGKFAPASAFSRNHFAGTSRSD